MMASVRLALYDDFSSPCRAHHRTRGKPFDRLAHARRGAPPFVPPSDFTLSTIQTICTCIPCAPSNTFNLISTAGFAKLIEPPATCASTFAVMADFPWPASMSIALACGVAVVTCPEIRQQLPSATSCGLSVSFGDKRALRPHLACSGLLHQPGLTHPASTGSMQ